MKALETITKMPVTWDEITSFVHRVKEEILSGDHDPLAVEIHLKAMEETIKALRGDAEIKEAVINEAYKWGKSFDFHGVKIQVRDAGVKCDYANTHDSEWALLDAELKELTEKKKAREKFLQSLPPEGTVSPITGEQIYPPVRTASETIVVTLK